MKTALFVLPFCMALLQVQAQEFEGKFVKKNYKCQIANTVEGQLITNDGTKIDVASYVPIKDGQNISVLQSSWEEKLCEGKSFKIYAIHKIASTGHSQTKEEGYRDAPNFEGTFRSAQLKCPSFNTQVGVLVTPEGNKYEISTWKELSDGQYIRTISANWHTHQCGNDWLDTYVINDLEVLPAQNKSKLPQQQTLEPQQNGAYTIRPTPHNNKSPLKPTNTTQPKEGGAKYILDPNYTAIPSQTKPSQTKPHNNTAIITFTGSDISIEDAQQALDFHNKARKDVGVAPLTWSVELSQYAQEWAEHLAANYNCGLVHRPSDQDPKNTGENIAGGNDRQHTALDASQRWYSEIKDFKNIPIHADYVQVVGHYTQMVWHNTTQVGIGIAKCSDNKYIIVANYNPPGNYIGQKTY